MSFKFKTFTVFNNSNSFKIGVDGVMLAAWTDVKGKSNIIDIGTGSGLIALCMAHRNHSTSITAVEYLRESYLDAIYNISCSPWDKRIRTLNIDVKEFCEINNNKHKFDLIVSNPPYFQNCYKSNSFIKKHSKHNKLLSIEDLAICIDNLMTKNGNACIILPIVEGELFIDIMTEKNIHLKKKSVFYSKINKKPKRLLLNFSRVKKEVKEDIIIQYNEDSTYTNQYKELTKEFYLKF